MNRTIIVIVIGVGLGGVVAGGIMTWAYVSQHSDEAIATPVLGEPEPPPPPRELITVDPGELALDEFVLGMAESQVAKTGRPHRLRFKKKVHDGGHIELAAIPKRPRRFRSVRILVAEGAVVGLRVKYTKPQTDTYTRWKELLGEAYYVDAEERHWETTTLKVKTRRDGTKFYVALKEYRGRFPW